MTGSIVIRGGRALVDGVWREGDLTVVDGVVVSEGATEGNAEFDAEGLLVAPGLIDLQCNGAAGIDLRSEPERLWEASVALPQWGVTAWLPTVVTSSPSVVERAQAAITAGPPRGWTGAVPLGLHLEGPFLSADAAGAHRVDRLRPPTLDAVETWSPERGVSLVTLAPELPGALEVIRELVSRGVVVSIGHSQASADEVDAAVDAGARCVTHLFNAMSPLHHRAPGVAGAALSDDRLTVGLIADGVHVDPRVVGIAERSVGERLALVSDAVAALGVGGYDWSDGVRLPDGTLAGSVLPLVSGVRNLVEWTGCPVERALDAAGRTPATLLGDATRGALAPGARGDVVVVTPDLHLVATVVAGEILHQRP